MGRVLFGVLVGLVVGLAIGFVLAPSGRESAAGVQPGGAVVDAAEPVTPERGEETPALLPASGPSREVVESTRVRPSVSEQDIAAALAKTGRPEIARGQGGGVLSGRVSDSDENPVAGVLLRAEAQRQGSRARNPEDVGQLAPEVSLEKAVREAAERFAERRSGLYETYSDADGSYRFEGLPEGMFSVHAYKKDYVFSRRDSRSSRVRTGSQAHFLAKAVVTVPVDVVLADGSSASEAVISCTFESGGHQRTSRYAWSAAERDIRLPAGDTELYAASQFALGLEHDVRSAGLRSEKERITLEAGVAPPRVVLQLDGRTGIRGTVEFSDDGTQGSGSARVYLLALVGAQEVDLDALRGSDQNESVRNASEFSFMDLAPGRYLVGLTRSWPGRVVTHRVVEVDQGIVRCDLVVPPVDPKDYLVVRAFGSDGKALTSGLGFSFRHVSNNGSSSSSSGISALRGADGAHYLSVPENARKAYYGDAANDGDTFEVTVSHDRYGDRRQSLSAGQAEVEIHFGEPGRLEVAVSGYTGSEHFGRVGLYASRAGESTHHYYGGSQGKLKGDGTRTFDALEPGAYLLNLTINPRGAEHYVSNTIATLEVQVRAGENSVRMAMPPLYTLDVVVPGAKEGARVSLSEIVEEDVNVWRNHRQERCDEHGRVRFFDLPSSGYNLSAHGTRSGRMRVDVPSGEVLFEPDEKKK